MVSLQQTWGRRSCRKKAIAWTRRKSNQCLHVGVELPKMSLAHVEGDRLTSAVILRALPHLEAYGEKVAKDRAYEMAA